MWFAMVLGMALNFTEYRLYLEMEESQLEQMYMIEQMYSWFNSTNH